jgi:hypothetical protein
VTHRSPRSGAGSSASLPRKSLSIFTQNPSPASYGVVSGPTSAPQTRYPFSSLRLSMARYPPATIPYGSPARHSACHRPSPYSLEQ